MVQPPYPGDGKVHVNVPGRAVARCGLPESYNPEVCALVSESEFDQYPAEVRCPTCAKMLADGVEGPAEWTGG